MEIKRPYFPQLQLHQAAQPPRNEWLFILGREHLLSLAEIAAVFTLENLDFSFIKHEQENLKVEIVNGFDASKMIKRLGGVIKISKKVGDFTGKQSLVSLLSELIPQGKIKFSLNGVDKKMAIEIKKELKADGRSVRYIEPKNTATITANKLIENGADLTVWNEEVFLTTAVQPFMELSERDYGRPGRDDFSGMLPPKLAMIMINLSQADLNSTIWDPFCGSGTIVTEAMLLGYKNIVGSDLSEKAVADTQTNIKWTLESNNLNPAEFKIKTIQVNVSQATKQLSHDSVNAIITEPYLGKPLRGNEDPNWLKKQAEELKRLYIDAFQQFSSILTEGSTLVFIIPRFKFRQEWIKINCIEEIKKLGFEPVFFGDKDEPLVYSRPDQRVAREIWKFIKV